MGEVIAFPSPQLSASQHSLLDVAAHGANSALCPTARDLLNTIAHEPPFGFEPTLREIVEFGRMWRDLIDQGRGRNDTQAMAEAVRVSLRRLHIETGVDLIARIKEYEGCEYLCLRNAIGALALLWQIRTYPKANIDAKSALSNRVITTTEDFKRVCM